MSITFLKNSNNRKDIQLTKEEYQLVILKKLSILYKNTSTHKKSEIGDLIANHYT